MKKFHDKNIILPLSPFYALPKMGQFLDIDLRIKRDDLLPVSGGGNKLRKVVRIFHEANRKGCNAVVTTGGVQSNHARVVALLAARHGWRCKLVLHGSPSALNHPAGNTFLMCLAGAEVVVFSPEKVAVAMEKAMHDFCDQGCIPYEIPGGGHSLEGAMSYVAAIRELEEQCRNDQWRPEWIIHASGTGTTQAGIIAGLESIGWQTRVVGISVARKNPRGTDIIEQSCMELRQHLKLNGAAVQPVDFRDNWIDGGYEKAGQNVFAVIRMAATMEGVILDPTYTGKAFCALIDLVRSGGIKKGARVLFWHTGGLMNLLASNYIADILQI